MNYPFISVVTPSLNQGDFIEDNIMSVMNQNYPDFEHIVVDAGSTDATLSILKKYSHLKWMSEPDKGQSDGLNKGFLCAKGDWILWLNADDFLMSNALNAYVKAISENPHADLIYGHTRFVDIDKKYIKTLYHIPFIYPMVLFGVYAPPSTGSLFRASILKENLLSTDHHYTMDTEWFLRCGKRLRSVLIDETTSAFRISNVNKTSELIRYGKIIQQHAYEQKINKQKYFLLTGDKFRILKENFYNIMKLLYKCYYYCHKSFLYFSKWCKNEKYN